MPDNGAQATGAITRSAALAVIALAATALAVVLLLSSEGADAAIVIDAPLNVTGTTVWANDTVEVRSDVTVAPGGVLNVTNATVRVYSSELAPIGITVEEGGELIMADVQMEAALKPYYVISSGELVARGCSFSGLMSLPPTWDVYFDEVGGLVLDGGTAVLDGVSIEGDSAAMLTAVGAVTIEAHDLRLTGSALGIVLNEVEASFTDLELYGFTVAIAADESILDLSGVLVSGCNNGLWASESTIRVTDMRSNATDAHVGTWNCTLTMRACRMEGGSEGVLAYSGVIDVEGCTFDGTATGLNAQLCRGSVVNCTVEGTTETGFGLTSLDSAALRPRFTFDRNVARGCVEAGVLVMDCGDVWVTNATLEGCGNGLYASGSRVHMADSTIDGSAACTDTSCESRADGTGAWLETSILWLERCAISGSAGHGVVAYYSDLSATGSSIVDGGRSGVYLIYGGIELLDAVVARNSAFGLDVLGYPVVLATLDAAWGNGRADVRYNITCTARVTDQEGATLAHANVSGSSHGESVGPLLTGFLGFTAPMELCAFQFTFPSTNVSYEPWSFNASYKGFSSITAAELPEDGSEVVLVIEVQRPDLVVEGLKVPKELTRERKVTLSATVRNAGVHPAEDVVVTFYYRNSAQFTRVIAQLELGTIAPGASVPVKATWTPDAPGEYNVTASADPDDDIEESSEDNNEMARAVEVAMEPESLAESPVLLVVIVTALVAGLVALMVWDSRRKGRGKGPEAAEEAAPEAEGADMPGGVRS